MERATNGKFVCECGKDYSTVQSLQRHKKSCNGWIPAIQIADDDIENEEGIPHCTKCWQSKNLVISTLETMLS